MALDSLGSLYDTQHSDNHSNRTTPGTYITAGLLSSIAPHIPHSTRVQVKISITLLRTGLAKALLSGSTLLAATTLTATTPQQLINVGGC